MSNIKYVLKTGNPKEIAGKNKTTFSLRKKALKKNLTPSKLTFSSKWVKILGRQKNVYLDKNNNSLLLCYMWFLPLTCRQKTGF